MKTILKNEIHTLIVDFPGERPRKHILESRHQALDLARKYIMTPGMVTIYDAKGNMVYRHAQPFRRTHRE